MYQKVQTALTVVCGLTLLLAFFNVPYTGVLSVAAGSPFALMSGWNALRERRIDVNILMILAGAGAVALGHITEAAVLLFLFSLSSTLEEFALGRTRSAIEGLIKLRPDQALLVTPEGDRPVPVSQVQPGDTVRVLAFEQVPLDGTVLSGQTQIDQSAMTGESLPVSKFPGEDVLCGTQNLEGMILVHVTKAVGDTTLEKIVGLVQDAQENKASGERVSQWFGQSYTLLVIGACAVSVIVRFAVHEPLERALYSSLTLLVALSPCALVISTPATTLSALAWSARRGILVRGGEFIELAGIADVVALDKTGTLTTGKPVLDEICVCGESKAPAGGGNLCLEEHACWSGGQTMSDDAKEVLQLAAAAEQYSTHPIAQAIVSAAKQQGIDIPEATEQQTVSGLGVLAKVSGREIKIGQRRFFEDLPEEFLLHVHEQQAKGMTVAILQSGESFAALGTRDAPRPEAGQVVNDLKGLGFKKIVMLTGDHDATAAAISSEVKIEEFRSSLLPDDKSDEVARLAKDSKAVIFVGDGTNDAPSLALSHVGVAMGGLGSDIAMNAADVVLVQDNLSRLTDLVRIGRSTNRVIRGNLYFSAGMIAFLTIGSMIVDAFFPAYRHSVLPFAVIGHEGSTVLVILSGLRLLKGPLNGEGSLVSGRLGDAR
ncbi:MAG: cation-translocating P-type ATPase [Chthonomonadaceae bacterium]|nr:cation-translocating P-type ATPase [Chthonomonadaceae bacterium]